MDRGVYHRRTYIGWGREFYLFLYEKARRGVGKYWVIALF